LSSRTNLARALFHLFDQVPVSRQARLLALAKRREPSAKLVRAS